MSSIQHKLWVEKYRPTDLQSYIFHDSNHKSAFERMVEQQTIPHLLLSGVQGSGKTSIAYILIDLLNIDPVDVLQLNGSDENSVDVMRDKIKNFISTFPVGQFKVVFLDEADYITLNGQAVLRNMMEQFADTARFILTCNHDNKLMPAIKSRCQQFHFKKHDVAVVTELAAKILLQEKVKFDLDVLDKFVRIGYPDIRKIINMLQQYSNDGKLNTPTNEQSQGDYKFKLLQLIEQDQWVDCRKVVCQNVAQEEWEDLYRFLYENIHTSQKFNKQDKWEAAIVIIADHLYKHSLVADPEINAAAMFIRLSQL